MGISFSDTGLQTQPLQETSLDRQMCPALLQALSIPDAFPVFSGTWLQVPWIVPDNHECNKLLVSKANGRRGHSLAPLTLCLEELCVPRWRKYAYSVTFRILNG